MILTAYNSSTDNLEKSYLSNSYAAGVTSIVVRNNSGMAVDDRIMLGEMGNEKTEIVTISAVNADKITLTVGATKFPHSADDPVYVLKYDQIKFYRSTTTIDGSYSSVATVDMDVDNAECETRYDDANGLTSYFYKIAFYHSIDTLESSLSDAYPGNGYSRRQVGYIINDFFTEVGDLGQQYMTVPQALNVMNECNDDLTTQSRKPYRFLKTSENKTVTADNDRVALPTDLLALDRIRYNYVSGATDRSDDIQIKDIEEFEYVKYDNNATNSDELQFIAIDESTDEIALYPTPATTQSNKLKVFYWKKFSDFDSLGDTIETPTPRVYKLFLSARFYRMRGLHDQSFLPLSDRYANDYQAEVVKMQRNNRIDRGSPMAMKPDTRTARGLRK